MKIESLIVLWLVSLFLIAAGIKMWMPKPEPAPAQCSGEVRVELWQAQYAYPITWEQGELKNGIVTIGDKSGRHN